jgi:hypothetical protein
VIVLILNAIVTRLTCDGPGITGRAFRLLTLRNRESLTWTP